MKISVIVCTYSPKFLKYLNKAVHSLIQQDYYSIQIIIVVDGNKKLQEKISTELLPIWQNDGSGREIILTGHGKNRGLSYSRNQGIKRADGDIIMFFDDDAVAHEEWVSSLVGCYTDDVIAAGGKILPIWPNTSFDFLPEEFYWLIGVTHKGFREDAGEVDNTFGSNISFRKELFDEIGGFDIRMGRRGRSLAQGEETELSLRMKKKFGKGVYYNPDAVVFHHVFSYRLDILMLFKRSYEQGRSKKFMKRSSQENNYDVRGYHDYAIILAYGAKKRMKNIIMIKKPILNIKQLFFLISCTFFIGAGYKLP